MRRKGLPHITGMPNPESVRISQRRAQVDILAKFGVRWEIRGQVEERIQRDRGVDHVWVGASFDLRLGPADIVRDTQ